MPLRRGEVRGYDFNRMIVEFTMLNQRLIQVKLRHSVVCFELVAAFGEERGVDRYARLGTRG